MLKPPLLEVDIYWSLENAERDGFKCRVNNWIIQHGYGQHEFDEKYLSYTKIYGPEKGFYEFVDDFGGENMPSIINRYIRVASDMGVFLAEGHMFPTHFQSYTEGEKHDDQPYEKILDHTSILYGEEFDSDFRIILQVFHSVGILKNLEDYLGIAFAQYPFSLQIHFVSFLAYATTDDLVRVKTYLAHAKTNEEKFTRLRVFLATSKGRNFGDLIIDIDNKLIEKFGETEGIKTSNELFEKYVEIMDIANEDAKSIKGEFYGTDSKAQFSKQKYIQELLSKANNILENFSKVLQNESSSEAVNEYLTVCNSDMIQYGSLFRVTDKNFDTKKPLIDSLKELGIELVEKMGPEMNSDDKTAMMQLYETNYQSHPKKDEYLASIARVLEGNYQNPKVKFFLLKYRGSPLLSAKFVEKEDGSVYFGAFNTALYFQQNQLGILVLEKLLENYADKVIRGHVIQDRKSLIRYYGRYGFEMEKDDNENSLKPDKVGGMEFCRMVRKPK